jgi:hypothetical protein
VAAAPSLIESFGTPFGLPSAGDEGVAAMLAVLNHAGPAKFKENRVFLSNRQG